jgi:hypothetical protein
MLIIRVPKSVIHLSLVDHFGASPKGLSLVRRFGVTHGCEYADVWCLLGPSKRDALARINRWRAPGGGELVRV